MTDHVVPPETSPIVVSPRIGRADLLIGLLLVLITTGVYSRVWNASFVNFDDNAYVIDNPHIRGEVTAETFVWAFTSGYPDNWFPLTRLSHLLDYQLFGPDARAHHMVNLIFHILAGLLLYTFLRRATRTLWPAAAVAFLFAIHPLHVESVAWVSERKDVLCATFWFATLIAWTWYAERPSPRRYLFALFLFALGLMSKPMIVTLPVLLLLVDYWPLRRPFSWNLVWEKIPFAVLSLGDAIATYLVQQSIGAVGTMNEYSGTLRVENALVTVAVYIGKMFWPSHLGALYPYPSSYPVWQPSLVAIAICVITFLAIRLLRYPWLAVGWLWYLITLIPVIGIVQVGLQSRADRYTYVPMVGISMIVVWSGRAMLLKRPSLKPLATGAVVLIMSGFAVVTWGQIPTWYNTQALFHRAIQASPGNYAALEYLANELAEKRSTMGEAISDFQAALRIRPDFVQAENGLGVTLFRMGLVPEAMARYREAIRMNPDYAEAHYDLGAALLSVGRRKEAIPEFEKALKINVSFAEAHNDLGAALFKEGGRTDEAIAHLERAIKIDPEYGVAHNNLGMAFAEDPYQLDRAIEHFQRAIRIQPRYADAWVNLGIAQLRVHQVSEAIVTLERALQLKPDAQLREQLDQIEAAEKNRTGR